MEALIPVVAIAGFFAWMIAKTFTKARVERPRGADAGEDAQRVAALEEQVSHLQGQVSELAERLDFAERMLAERRERKLGAGQ
jgi:TolA-binding protein